MDLPSYFLAKDSLSTDSIQYEYKYDGDGRLTEVWRNEQQYKLLYHDSGHVTEIISPDGSSFGIEEAADSSVVLHDGSFGEMVLSAKEWQSLNDSLAAVRKNAQASTRNDAPVEISTRREKMLAATEMQEKKQKERNSQKDDPSKKKQEAPGQEAAQNVMERRKKILSNYYSLSDLLTPKKIAHEWIWERM